MLQELGSLMIVLVNPILMIVTTMILNVIFSFHSSCGLFVDRGMGNHMLARQVVIRSFTSSR